MTQTTSQPDFASQFRSLTGNPPLPWQERLFHDHLAQNDIPPVIDLPTGLGKTMVMAIWLVARTVKESLPRRLIYVVDRRTVVDQATDLAIMLKNNAPGVLPTIRNLAVSTLRGQLADNRDWTRDPSRPAIIIGTVDLIGSALLFSGYRSSSKRRPLEAGLLGQDSLLVLDEAHLSKPFEKLICAIGEGGPFQKKREDNTVDRPMQVIRMSATSAQPDSVKPSFVLRLDENGNLTDDDAKDTITADRFNAKKRLTITTLGEKDSLNRSLVDAAIRLAEQRDVCGRRIVVFVRSPEDARDIATTIRNYKKPAKSKANPEPKGPYADSVECLTGTMRGLERDELVEKAVFKHRWLKGELDPSDSKNRDPVFLVSTSAGEVGFDLNADHLVGDAAPLDSWIQRLGRVNRRGKGIAIVRLFVAPSREKEVKEKDGDKHTIASASARAIEALKQLPPAELLEADKRHGPILDASPRALRHLSKPDKALSPPPKMVELTDVLLDAWSMTSVTERMPGRLEVAPWLRGIADDQPQTTIAWRGELDLPGFDQLDLEDIEEWYDTHAIRTHESLSVPTTFAAKWYADRWDNLDAARRSVVGACPIIVDRAGLKLITVKGLLEQLVHKNTDSILNAELILPASFGGIERGVGLLDASAPHQPIDETDADGKARKDDASPDVADERGRYRELVTTNEEGLTVNRPIGSGTKPADASRFVLELESSDDARAQLVSYVPKWDKPEWGSKRQTLNEHVGLVRKRLDEILCRLDLSRPLKRAAELAAQYHDHGKNRKRWQRTVNGEATPVGEQWTDRTIGKSGGVMKRDVRHYRHEFGSIREFIDAHRAVPFPGSTGADITHEVIDLALHLIAVHHGRGRPHFPKGGFDPDAEQRTAEIHAEIIRRFARLQRRYGWWRLAWLENLLRCADALASADDVSEDDVGEASEGSREDS